jgi:hypothetical protein
VAEIPYVPALKPERDSEALALPPDTVAEVTDVPFTTKVTVPELTPGPLPGVTVALSVTDAAPNVAAAFDAAVVVAMADAPTVNAPEPSAKSPLPAVFAARTVNAVEPAGVPDVVLIVRVDVIKLVPFEKLRVAGLNDALVPAGRTLETWRDASNAVPGPDGPLRVTVTRYVALPALPADSGPDWAPTVTPLTRLMSSVSCCESTLPLP